MTTMVYYVANASVIQDRPERVFQGDAEGLFVHMMAVTHYVQKNTLDKLTASRKYEKLSLVYEAYISRLAERDYSPGELAAVLGISRQACSKSIKELETLGLITRRKNPEDSRSSLLSLTGKGRALLRDGIEAVNEIEAQFAEKVGSKTLQRLVSILEKLCQNLQIEIPAYQVFDLSGVDKVESRPKRLILLLPKLTDHFRQTLFESLSDKGFKGLKSNFGQVMGLISQEGVRIQYIASVIGVSKQAIAATAAELEQQGYITREPDPDDRRQITLGLSPLGQRLLTEAVASVRSLEVTIENLLSTEEFLFLESSVSALCFQVADYYDQASALPARIKRLSDSLLTELGTTGAHALAQRLITITRGKL